MFKHFSRYFYFVIISSIKLIIYILWNVNKK